MSSPNGYIKLPRALLEHPMFRRKPYSDLHAWVWLVAEAAYKPRRKRVGDTIFDLQRGQIAVSERFMAEAWGWERSKVHRFLRRLKTEHLIEPLTHHDATVLTICNYEENRFDLEDTEPHIEPSNEPLANHSRTKLEEIKHLNKDIEGEIEGAQPSKELPGKRARKTALTLENPEFEKFWSQYPKQTDIGNARRLFDRIVSEGIATSAELVAGAMRYSAERSGEEDRFTKSPVNWLTGECWRDASRSLADSRPRNRQPLQKTKADSAIDGIMSYFQERNET